MSLNLLTIRKHPEIRRRRRQKLRPTVCPEKPVKCSATTICPPCYAISTSSREQCDHQPLYNHLLSQGGQTWCCIQGEDLPFRSPEDIHRAQTTPNHSGWCLHFSFTNAFEKLPQTAFLLLKKYAWNFPELDMTMKGKYLPHLAGGTLSTQRQAGQGSG